MESYNKYNSFRKYRDSFVRNAQSLYYRDKEEEEEEEKNNGGFFGGLGYFFEKIGLGFMQGIEGIVDYTVGGVSELLGAAGVDGADEFAEDVISTDWMNYNHADEWFDPSEGWKVAGDVAGGIGTSLPGILTTVGLAAATGGASLAVQAAGLGVSGLSAAGTSTKEAYQETGTLGGKEFGYGALSGAVEAGTELLTGKVLGTGLTKAANATTAALGKGATAFAKTVGKNAAFGMAKEFTSEAFEEGFAEWISPYIKRITYDPNAEKATAEEIAYAALVGGLSGVVTGGATTAVVRGKNAISGAVASKKGETSTILDKAQLYMGEESATSTDFRETVEKIYKKYQDTTGDGILAKTKRARLLGELKSAEVNGAMSGMVKRSAISATQNAEAIAQRLNSDGRYKMVDGKLTFVADSKNAPTGDNVRDITAEDIRRGYDPSKKNSLDKALKDNEVLRYVAASDAAGRFMLQATEVENATLRGEQIRNETEYKRLREEASPEARAAMSRELGIDLNTASLDDFNAAVKAYKESGKADAYQAKIKRVEEIKSKKDSKAYAIPRAISLADGGIRHYTDGQSNIAIARDGESFIIYDYDSGKVSRSLSRAEVNKALAKYRNGTMSEAVGESVGETTENVQNATESASENVQEKAESDSNIWEKGVTEADRKAATEARKQAAEIDSYAKENIKDYDNLSRANKLTVRDVIRKARESGISEVDALSYARVAARTGLDIQFNQKECYKGKNEAGEDVYHAGFYDPENNRIVINPKTEKKHTVLLIHELSHAMRSYLKNGEVKYFIDDAALKIDKKTGKLEKGEVKLSPEMWAAVKKYYTDKNGKLDTELAYDEASAYYAEALFGTEGAIDLLLGEKPTLRQKILSFFTKSAAYYSTDEKLSKEARRHFKKFKAMFDSFALRNTVNNTDVATVGGKANRRYSFSSIAFSFHGVDNMTAAEFEAKDYKKTEGYKAYVDECLENMRQTQKGFDEKKAKKYVEDSIDGIVSVAVAMKKAGYDIADTAEQRSAKDTKDRLLFSSLEPNSDYFTSSDISTICDKRQNFAEIYDEIVKAEEAKGVPKGKRFFDNVDNYFYIHKVLADKGLTQPCRQCYVESMRKNLAPMANAFLTLVQESDGNNTKNAQLYNQSGKDKGKLKSNNATTREEVRKILDGYGFSPDKLTVKMLTTADGLAEIKLTMPELYERFNSFYGQSKPKMPKGATPFRFGELTALLTDNKGRIKEGLVKKINSTGGFRLQSYSDFQTKNYADVLQVLFEASTLGLNGHAYTKVPAFLDATADTNLKRNISIFMYNDGGKWKIDRNDSFPYTLEQIYDIVRADKSGNTGIIAVVQNEDMAAYVMANDNIGYFIPFHKSGIKMGVVRETTVKEGGREIKGYKNIKDHTRQQTEVWAKTTEEHKANTKVSNPINIYEEGLWDFENADGLSRNELIEKNVKAYIDECEKRGYLPKFREYVMNNERVLNSVLSYAKELGTVAETATVDDISFEYKGYRIPYGYYKCLGDFSMITPDGKASGIEPLSLENYKFDKAVKYFSDAESVRRNEILQQFANGNEREYYRDSTMSAEELQKVLDTKRTEVVNEIVGKSARRASAEFGNSESKSARRYSMAGINAATADNSRLMTAEAMLAEGKDSETVRKATGWFKSYDGKWRFEIDDSVAVWHLDSAKPDSKRLFEFGERIYKLGDILDHPELYEAYPQLKEVTVWENPNAKTSGYVVGRNTDNITVQSLADREINKDILIHEIQHIIQNIEGFAPGASVDQFDYKAWGEKEFAAYEKRNEVANKLYAILRRHGVSITKADIEAVRTAFEVRDSIIDYNFMLIESLADNNARTRDLLDQYYAQVQILNLTTPEGQYHAVAGEIEAHDVQARRRMTAEQGKNTRPNIDREDAILIENSSKNSRRASAEGISNTSADIEASSEASSEAGDAGGTDVGLPRRAARANMTVGQLKKHLANYSRAKTYSRKDAMSIVGKVYASDFLNEKTRNEIAESIWQIYNEALTKEEREAAAHDIAQYFALKLFSEAKVENPDAKNAQEDLVYIYLSEGIGRLSFTREQLSEIKRRENATGAKSILGRWGYKGDKKQKNGITLGKISLDTFVVDIAREMPGMAYLEDMNAVDAFLEINTIYTATREIALDKEMSAFWDVPESGFEDIVKSIQNDIMQGYIDTGSKSKFATMFEARIEYYQKRAESFQKDFEEIRDRDKINGMLVNQALRMRDLKIGKFKNATQDQTDIFKKSIETLANVQWRGNISVKRTRKAIKALCDWYTNEDVKKALFGFVDNENPGKYNEGIAQIMKELSKDENKPFSKIELYGTLDVMGYFTNFVETFGKIWRKGQWIDAEAEAKGFMNKIPSASKKRRGAGKLTKNLADKYLTTFADPETVIRRMDDYEDGFFTEMFEDLREAAINADAAEIDMLADYDEFIKSNKGYLEKAKTEKVKFNGADIPKIDLISLYMTLRDEHSHAGFAINGFDIRNKDGTTTRIPGGLSTENASAESVKAYVNAQMSTIDKLLTDADRAYMRVLEQGYVMAGNAKAFRDYQKYGFTNVSGNYYYPIRRANIASNIDKSEIQEELDRVSNASFNKDRVKGSKQELFIEDADKLFRRHIHAVSQYSNLSPVIDSFNMLYNYDVSGNPNHPISIRTESQNVWTEAFSYFSKLIADVQGVSPTKGPGAKLVGNIRSNYAKFQLGANPKTWVSQLSSLFASSSLLDIGIIGKSVGISGADVDNYCKLARIRHYDNAAAKAQAVADNKVKGKTDKLTDLAMKPIGGVDRFVITRLFAACQSQVQADGGAKVGTEENKIAAGKLLTRVILETQQNSLATEKSAAMRSGNEFYKALTMFRADAMKVVGRVIDSYGEVRSLKQKIKNEQSNPDEKQRAENIEVLKKKLNKARKKAAKASYALAMTSIFTALVAQGFKWLYAKERDEDEAFVEDFAFDTLGNMIGGLPILTDAYNYFVEGFDVENYHYTAVNDFLSSAQGIINMFDGNTSSQEIARGVKNLTYSLGQLSGIPTRNLYNVFYGLTKRISPETGYAIDSVFFEKNYKNDYYKAIENDDEDMAAYLLQLLAGERLSGDMGENTYNTILTLSKAGYKILPKEVPDKITVDGVEYELDEGQMDTVRTLYNVYIKNAEGFVNSAYYNSLNNDSKCEAITYYFDLVRDRAISEALDVDRGRKVELIGLLGEDEITKLHVATKGIESDVDKQGNTIAGSKKTKVLKAIKRLGGSKSQQVLMLYASGYTVQDGDIKGVSASNAKKLLLNAIMKLNVSKEEKAEIAKSFGFTVKNGKIIKDF